MKDKMLDDLQKLLKYLDNSVAYEREGHSLTERVETVVKRAFVHGWMKGRQAKEPLSYDDFKPWGVP